MLKVIKKPTVVLAVFMAAMATSCTNDDYSFFGDDDLNLNSQIPMTRSTQFAESANSTRTESDNKKITTHYANECGLNTLAELAIKQKDDQINQGLTTAQQIYENMRTNVNSNSIYNWEIGDSAMSETDFKNVAINYQLASDYKVFANDQEMLEWMSNEKNRKSVLALNLDLKDSTYSHYVRVTSQNQYHFEYSGYNPFKENYNGGEIYYQDQFKKNGEIKNPRSDNMTIRGVLVE